MKTKQTLNMKRKTEKQLREAEVPWPKTEKALMKYINSLVSQEHDYGTAAYAMSMSAVAAYNYASSKVGASGFQAGCADMDILRRTRGLKGPFMIVDITKAMYPQYDLMKKLSDYLLECRGWLRDEAKKQLADEKNVNRCHPDVVAHWKKLAAYKGK